MASFVVEGGQSLCGAIRPQGNKNAALPAIAASLLGSSPTILKNIPRILDVVTMLEILESLGAEVTWEDQNVVCIDPRSVRSGTIDQALAQKIRASLLLAGPLLARFGRVQLPPPGGDVIGRRRMDTHFLAFESLGADVSLNSGFEIECRTLQGADIFLDEPSVTATENAIMAAVLAEGESWIRNAASEPHVQDLCLMLMSMGALIEGVGSNQLRISGVRELHGTTFTIGMDHIETGSFIGLAGVTGSEILIKDAPVEHMTSTFLAFRRLGVDIEINGSDIRVFGGSEKNVVNDAFGSLPKIDDGPWPAFPADLTSIALVAATQCNGTVLVHEKMFESRMFFTDKLVAMGAQIILCDPHRAVVVGPSRLRSANLESPDIRAGMALLIAALGADGVSRIQNIGQIERGYERIGERLRGLGAKIERLD
jgi:UDP-N-acetylglucosamine 1-carboxyvinyltransferase